MSEQDQVKKAHADIQRAEQAKQLLENPLLKGFFIAMKAAHFEEFEQCAWDDDAKRRELANRMKLLSQFEGQFKEAIKQGDKAQTTLQMIAKKIKSIVR